MAADAQSVTVGSTYRFQITATKDGVAWNLTSATVKLYLQKPDGTATEYAATVTSGAGGVAKYDCATTDLDVPGPWRRSWHITDGAVVQESAPIPFVVQASPGG